MEKAYNGQSKNMTDESVNSTVTVLIRSPSPDVELVISRTNSIAPGCDSCKAHTLQDPLAASQRRKLVGSPTLQTSIRGNSGMSRQTSMQFGDHST